MDFTISILGALIILPALLPIARFIKEKSSALVVFEIWLFLGVAIFVPIIGLIIIPIDKTDWIDPNIDVRVSFEMVLWQIGTMFCIFHMFELYAKYKKEDSTSQITSGQNSVGSE